MRILKYLVDVLLIGFASGKETFYYRQICPTILVSSSAAGREFAPSDSRPQCCTAKAKSRSLTPPKAQGFGMTGRGVMRQGSKQARTYELSASPTVSDVDTCTLSGRAR